MDGLPLATSFLPLDSRADADTILRALDRRLRIYATGARVPTGSVR